ncbi:conserved hypothetical protein [Talaromyces stipitatus ATCC 10500]|uniref:ABM domain-containing protein n=1 Tax=Talaromyces stipitatus (strain ATCC 10500 / CBS 375.48 / QM 6759 / NRRL 1006) TaxID=441959 RepID=B8M419_TALSN|nr:uncharacterized protein TSTA_039590 [Talaromyces stipitatus ATCC 10500]EED20762.1 conserved hypothetical protein [Talaromyces stipitatus ATCC 10500]
MPVTELALFHFKNNKSIDSPENEAVKAKLLSGIKDQASYASYPVYLLTQVEDPSYLYLVGGWESVETHMEKWIPSKTNQDIMLQLQDNLEVAWLQHLDVSPGTLSPDSVNLESECSGIPLAAPVIAISRYFINPLKRGDFQSTLATNKHHLLEFTKASSIGGGWRLDPEKTEDVETNMKDEFVLFSGWGAIENHLKFAETESFKEFGKIKGYLEGAEIKHARRPSNVAAV